MPSPVTAIAAKWTAVPAPDGTVRVLENATVLVQDTRITDVVPAATEVNADRRIEVNEGIVFPGFVNLHNHSINGPIFRGIVDDVAQQASGDSLVYSLLLPLGDHASEVLTDDEIRAIYQLAIVEILRSGTTSVLEMPRAVHKQFFTVAKELGLRAFGAPYIFSTPSRGVDASGKPIYVDGDGDKSLDDALRIADEFDEGPDGLIRVGFGPHATDTCSPELLRRIRQEAQDRDTIVSIHVAQSRTEIDAIRERHGCTPVEYLHRVGLLGPNVVAAHCVFADDGDLDILWDTGTTVANCPLTFARGGLTVSFDRFHRHGIRTGIGTDAYNFDYFSELRAAGFVSKLTSGESGVAGASTLLRAGTMMGADALMQPRLGRIERGCLADLVVVDLSGPHVQPVRDPVKNLVWNATPADVSTVMINGRIVVENGSVRGCDEPKVVRSAASAVAKLWESAERAGILAPRKNGVPA